MLLQRTKILKIPTLTIFKFNNIRIYRNYKKILIKVFHTQLFLGKRPFSFLFFFFEKDFLYKNFFKKVFFFGLSPPPFFKLYKIIQNYTKIIQKLYKIIQKLYKKFIQKLYKIIQNYTKLYKNYTKKKYSELKYYIKI